MTWPVDCTRGLSTSAVPRPLSSSISPLSRSVPRRRSSPCCLPRCLPSPPSPSCAACLSSLPSRSNSLRLLPRPPPPPLHLSPPVFSLAQSRGASPPLAAFPSLFLFRRLGLQARHRLSAPLARSGPAPARLLHCARLAPSHWPAASYAALIRPPVPPRLPGAAWWPAVAPACASSRLTWWPAPSCGPPPLRPAPSGAAARAPAWSQLHARRHLLLHTHC